jgi:hypothetical protein
VYHRELVGEGNLKERLCIEGKWKLNDNFTRVIIKYPKLSKKAEGYDVRMEKQTLYSGFFFPGDGSIRCENDSKLIFK